jgi:hypothetical protein
LCQARAARRGSLKSEPDQGRGIFDGVPRSRSSERVRGATGLREQPSRPFRAAVRTAAFLMRRKALRAESSNALTESLPARPWPNGSKPRRGASRSRENAVRGQPACGTGTVTLGARAATWSVRRQRKKVKAPPAWWARGVSARGCINAVAVTRTAIEQPKRARHLHFGRSWHELTPRPSLRGRASANCAGLAANPTCNG